MDFGKYRIYLASKSPRRNELLRGMGFDFEVMPTNVREEYPSELSPAEVAEYLSALKLSTIDFSKFPQNSLFIACDTIVVVGDEILGKPVDATDAYRMLRTLSEREHEVISGLTVMTESRKLTRHRTTKVKFRELTDDEIHYYIEYYKPFDKAGAYGVQEWIGYVGIEYIDGSYYNVMGLPTQLLWQMMADISL
jgi:septum formation protein